MSERYEGVVFRTDEQTALRTFGKLASALGLRLVRLAPGVFGIYRVAGRADALEQRALKHIAKQVSAEAGRAAAHFYDNNCGVGAGVLYSRGCRSREFGDGDAWWVPYNEDGELVLDGLRLRVNELQPGEEYDCIYSALDAVLDAVGTGPRVSTAVVKQAFCYEKFEALAESGGSA